MHVVPENAVQAPLRLQPQAAGTHLRPNTTIFSSAITPPKRGALRSIRAETLVPIFSTSRKTSASRADPAAVDRACQ
jgi:hypothetical protein